MRIVVVVVLGFLLVGCGTPVPSLPIVESRCSSQYEYVVRKASDNLRLNLEVGRLSNQNGCVNRLGVRHDSVVFRTSVKSLDEAHMIIESEVERYKQAQSPKLPANQK